MSRRLVVDASAVVDLLGRFRPEPIEAQSARRDLGAAALVTRDDRLARSPGLGIAVLTP